MYNYRDYMKRGSRFLNNQLRPSQKKLSTLMLYATDLCDSGCKHCLIWAKRPVNYLPLEKIIEVLNSRCVDKDTTVGLEGGEFLLHPQAHDIMDWLSKNHPNFDLLSNCLKPSNVIEAVKKYPPKRLFLSLDGTKETYQYMRGKDGYDSVLKVIESLYQDVPISLMFTLSPYNTFEDLRHVVEVSKKYNIDVRTGVYNNVPFFDTDETAHHTEIGTIREKKAVSIQEINKKAKKISYEKEKIEEKFDVDFLQEKRVSNGVLVKEKAFHNGKFKNEIPSVIKDSNENYDYLLLYDEWRRKKTKLKCFSILDSLVIHPDGNVPVCQSLDVSLGNVFETSLDNIYNSAKSQLKQKQLSQGCNQCWLSFHRKYDIILMRTLEKFLPKFLIERILGPYQWTNNKKTTYKKFIEQDIDS